VPRALGLAVALDGVAYLVDRATITIVVAPAVNASLAPALGIAGSVERVLAIRPLAAEPRGAARTRDRPR